MPKKARFTLVTAGFFLHTSPAGLHWKLPYYMENPFTLAETGVMPRDPA